ncbi:hypothetical protein SDC9_183482 [bioreactor metagenome]|uniref:Uncharacterized protein n=1 Tax=bioreactor metagenome TaxID=1076179 RepID=A0A645HAC1_9ZZZZ
MATSYSFKIPSALLTTNKSIRFPNDVIDNIENAITGKECTFSKFVIEAARSALENLEQNETNKPSD